MPYTKRLKNIHSARIYEKIKKNMNSHIETYGHKETIYRTRQISIFKYYRSSIAGFS